MDLGKCLFVFNIIFLIYLNVVYSQVYHIADSQHPDHPGKCFFPDNHSPEGSKNTFFLKPGQRRKHPKKCQSVWCDNDFGLTFDDCGPIPPPAQIQCKFVRDVSLPYPRCCGEYVC